MYNIDRHYIRYVLYNTSQPTLTKSFTCTLSVIDMFFHTLVAVTDRGKVDQYLSQNALVFCWPSVRKQITSYLHAGKPHPGFLTVTSKLLPFTHKLIAAGVHRELYYLKLNKNTNLCIESTIYRYALKHSKHTTIKMAQLIENLK